MAAPALSTTKMLTWTAQLSISSERWLYRSGRGQGDNPMRFPFPLFWPPTAIIIFPAFPNKPLPWATSIGLGLTEDRLCLDRLPATVVASFFPPPSALHRQTKKPSPVAFHCVSALAGAVRSSPVARPPSRPRKARLKWKRITIMATIGTFTKTENGYTGSVKTLTLNVKAKITPAEGENERGPDFRIFAGATEFGAAWKKTAKETQRDYLSVKLDDPSFPAPIYASLVEAEDGNSFNLIWSRRNGD